MNTFSQIFIQNPSIIIKIIFWFIHKIFDLIIYEILLKMLYSIMQFDRRKDIRIQTVIHFNMIDEYDKAIDSRMSSTRVEIFAVYEMTKIG